MDRYSLGSVARFYLDVIAAGVGVISQSPTIAIRRIADGLWFENSSGTWVGTKVENAMTETDSVNLPGRYEFDFDQSLDLLAGSKDYLVKKSNAIGTVVLEYGVAAFGPMSGSASPELCSVQGTIYTPQGERQQNALVRATLEPVLTDGQARAFVADRVLATYTNELGDFDFPLIRGGIFRLEIESVGYNRRVTIPDAASVLFTDL